MIKYTILTTIAIALSLTLLGQDTEYASYSWSNIPTINNSDTIKTFDGAAVLFEKRIQEVFANKEEIFEEIYVFHRMIKVETANAVSRFNRIYVPLTDVLEILNLKARFISKSGKVTELPKESIKEVQNLENNGNYKVFAIEGCETGGTIEYFYVLRRSLKEFGGVTIQSETPCYNVNVLFIFPDKLDYDIRSYNGFPTFNYLPTKDEKKYLTAQAAYIPGVESEKYANYDASMMHYEYALVYNNYAGASRIYSWSKSAKFFYDNVYNLNSKEEKAVSSFFKTIEINKLNDEVTIRSIEAKVKTEIAVSNDIDKDLTLDDIVKQKRASSRGVTKLLIALYQKAGIKVEMVLTSDRTARPFDPTFNCMNFLNNFLLYFPSINRYIVPDNPAYRLGIMPENLTATYGIFYHPIEFDKSLKGLGYDIKQIPQISPSQNTDSMIISVALNPENMEVLVKTDRIWTGVLAQSYQSFWNFITDEQRQTILKSVFNLGTDNSQIKEFKVKNTDLSDIGVSPMILEVSQIAPSLVERADNDILIHIGEVIGSQSELYQEKERKLPIATSTIMHYFRQIEFQIPEGYKVLNLSDLNMKVEMLLDAKPSCGFYSSYTLNGNVLKIISKEFYSQENYPASDFEQFRAVINAAADFNKKTLVLTKK
jgi:hypothetical protein